jgi:hypothetical protein
MSQELSEKRSGSIDKAQSPSSASGAVEVSEVDDDGELLLPHVREAAEKALVRRLDSRLLPTIVLIFIMNYIDVST